MTLKAKLKNGDLTIGSWITLAHPSIAEIMAQSGFDWLTIDLEHSAINVREMEELIRVIDLCGISALVRPTSNNPDQIKRAMDSGAAGLIVPMVNSKKDAEKAVSAVRYPPTGTRGVGLARAHRWGNRFDNYFTWQEQEAVVIVQIEHIEAVRNIDDIFTASGVDGFIIGPYDLTASMGIPGEFDNPEFLKAMECIQDASRKHLMAGGVHVIEPDSQQLQDRIKQGFKFIAYSLDVRMIDSVCRLGLDSIKGERK